VSSSYVLHDDLSAHYIAGHALPGKEHGIGKVI